MGYPRFFTHGYPIPTLVGTEPFEPTHLNGLPMGTHGWVILRPSFKGVALAATRSIVGDHTFQAFAFISNGVLLG